MERDDLIVNDSYSLQSHHSEEKGVEIRKKVVKVTILLTLITAVEVAMGVYFKRSEAFTWQAIKWTFIVLTLVKAGYIVMSFMHLGEERKNLRNVVLIPYFLFIAYLIFIALYEGAAHLRLFESFN
ncbi:MAG: cytochrome C oxidase subunit IV family protein [Flavobacteriales bacterium]|jgi:cytochrome c oxidase subunit IV